MLEKRSRRNRHFFGF